VSKQLAQGCYAMKPGNRAGVAEFEFHMRQRLSHWATQN